MVAKYDPERGAGGRMRAPAVGLPAPGADGRSVFVQRRSASALHRGQSPSNDLLRTDSSVDIILDGVKYSFTYVHPPRGRLPKRVCT